MAEDKFVSWTPTGPRPPFTAIYDQDYFSGSQVSIYIGDVWIDEVTSLSYACSQDKRPLYGYASQLFDATAAGPVIVQGNFTINYKEQGYLHAVLDRYHEYSGKGWMLPPISASTNKDYVSQNAPSQTPTSDNIVAHDYVYKDTIERVLQGNLTNSDLYSYYTSLAGYVTFDTASPTDQEFEQLTDAFENQVWNFDTPRDSSQARRTDANKYDGFDMYVVFGNFSNDMSNHTCQKIEGVRLLSQGKQIVVGGAPIQEEYSFLARTVV